MLFLKESARTGDRGVLLTLLCVTVLDFVSLHKDRAFALEIFCVEHQAFES